MRRSRFVQSTAGALLLVTAIYAVTSACWQDFTAPCAQDPSARDQRGLLDGTWRATTINGQPAQGWPLPFPSADYFYSGIIDFQTTETYGDCDNLTSSTGNAVALYALRRGDGSLSGNKRFVGKFYYQHATNLLVLTAAGYQLNGSRSGTTMTLPASHAIFGTATVVLRRD